MGELGILPDGVLKVGIVGFAGSRGQAPFQDPSWHLLGINDVYAHVPRIDQTFELHQPDVLMQQGRRNTQYFDWLAKASQPVWMVAPRPEWGSSRPFPFAPLRALFPREYWTNSVAWVMAAILIELTDVIQTPDGRMIRIGKPGAQIGLWGIHMASGSEYQDQRRCCEYIIGLMDACQVPVTIPDDSELMKCAAIYGLDTTEPLRRNLEQKIAQCVQAGQQVDQQIAQMQAQMQALAQQRASITGQKEAYKALRNNWTMPTDLVPTAEEREARHAVQPSDHQLEQVQVPMNVTVTGG